MNRKERDELASRFEKVADDLEAFCKKHGLDETEVDMGEPYDNRKEFENLCETPACHGGWIAMLYSDELPISEVEDIFFFKKGAVILAKKLGFLDETNLEIWADQYPGFWGENGISMFGDGSAFGQDTNYFPLSVIYKHYRKVAERLRAKD